MENYQRLSIHEITRFLRYQPPDIQDVVLELRDLVISVASGATERILWKSLSYYNADVGGPVKGAICQISVHGNHVRLSFIHGSFLPDPIGLLEGDRKYKRFVRIGSIETIPRTALKELIVSAARFRPAASV